jgi:hypothetical protein
VWEVQKQKASDSKIIPVYDNDRLVRVITDRDIAGHVGAEGRAAAVMGS